MPSTRTPLSREVREFRSVRPSLIGNYGDEISANTTTRHLVALNGDEATVRIPSRVAVLNAINDMRWNDPAIIVNATVETADSRYRLHEVYVSRVRTGRRVNFHIQALSVGNLSAAKASACAKAIEHALNGTTPEWINLSNVRLPDALGFEESHSLFQRTYSQSASVDFTSAVNTISEGFGVPTVGINGARTFGIEIEIDFPNSSEWGREQTLLAEALYSAGLARDDEFHDWHTAARRSNDDGTRGYSTDRNAWSVEFDRSVDDVNGQRGAEIVSPILTDTPEVWRDVEQVLAIVRSLGGETTRRTGLHVNIGCSDMDRSSLTGLVRINSQFDDLIVRLSHTNEIGEHHRGRSYCRPVWYDRDSASSSRLADYVYENNGHTSAVNLAHTSRLISGRPSNSARIEFRYFDGTLEIQRIQAHVMLCIAMVNASIADISCDLQTQRGGEHVSARRSGSRARTLSGEAWRNDTLRVRQFIDLIRLPAPAATMVAALYRNSRWMLS